MARYWAPYVYAIFYIPLVPFITAFNVAVLRRLYGKGSSAIILHLGEVAADAFCFVVAGLAALKVDVMLDPLFPRWANRNVFIRRLSVLGLQNLMTFGVFASGLFNICLCLDRLFALKLQVSRYQAKR